MRLLSCVLAAISAGLLLAGVFHIAAPDKWLWIHGPRLVALYGVDLLIIYCYAIKRFYP